MYYSDQDIALVDEIFALETEISEPKTGEDAILLSLTSQPLPVRRAFYLCASESFRKSYLEDLKVHQLNNIDVMPKVYDFLAGKYGKIEQIEALVAEEFHDAESIKERFPLMLKSMPPLLDADAKPPVRSMEYRMRLSLLGYSQATRDALAESFAALRAEGTTPLRRQADILAQLEGYRNAAVAESVRQEAMLDLACEEEEFLCGGEC